MNDINNSALNRIIPPEIKNDEFYATLQRIAREENIKTVLEIGSSSGAGSTEAFVSGLRENPNHPTLFCMEVSKPRFEQLQKTYQTYSFVKCYNLSSVSLDQFPSPEEVTDFYHKNRTNLNQYPLELVLDWLRQDKEYIIQSGGGSKNGIQAIKAENNIELFDLVLIDGSEFTGKVELDEVYGAKYICLDDILTYKNYSSYHKLRSDSNYILLAENHSLRNGYAIFKTLSGFANERKEQLIVRNLVVPGMTVFDVGANIGEYSILFGELVGSAGKVYAFEPTSSTYEKLKQQIAAAGLKNVVAIQKAVYSQNQQIEFNEFAEEYAAWNSIGKPQMVNPKNYREYVPIVRSEIVEAITLDSICQANGINRIDYLKIDVEGAESDVLRGATKLLKSQAIRYIQFEISQKMLEGLNRTAKETFEILAQYGYSCYKIADYGAVGEQVFDSNAFYENYIALPTLPVHFFTIVLNGEPFIRYHIEVFQKLPFKWHWHIVEGVAELKHDTAWSLQLGGRITDEIHRNGRSNDGTSEYLDELAQLYPDNVTVYRKPEGQLWDGKLEMVNAPLGNIQEECLLWQVDVDELWTEEQIRTTRQMFLNQPEKTAAFYWCWYFVGENRVISTRNCYTQNPQQDWLRTWRYKPGYFWATHEPPILVEHTPEGKLRNVAALNPFKHEETENQGLVFQHFAYVTPEQLRFKERYYGYRNALTEWQNLQNQNQFPVLLREYFSWVGDDTMVDTADACGVMPLARKDATIGDWKFLSPEQVAQLPLQKTHSLYAKILIDGVFFQLYNTGIARVWRSLLQEWSNQEFAKHIVVLDRVGTAPKIPGIRYRTIPAYDYDNTDVDKQMLQEICDEEGADVFISTYYTTPVSTPSVFMAYDMIPEVLGADFNEPMWREKHYGIEHASAYISISENTAQDLAKVFPNIALDAIKVAHCGVTPEFYPATTEEINCFKTKYGISKPYFLLVGMGSNYKNASLFLKAFSQLPTKQGFEIVATGSGYLLSAEMRQYTSGVVVHLLQLEDAELKAAYSGAVALVYPSIYEGFGLPVLEALACGCPVITCPNASIPEVAGEAAIYVNHEDVDGLTNAMCDVQKPSLRQSMIAAGLAQAQKFSWASMAKKVRQALISATLLPLNLQTVNLIIFPDWQQPEESLGAELQAVLKTVATHPNKSGMTLLIYRAEMSEEDANLMLSTVAMNLLMEEDLDVSDGPVISLVGELDPMQWQALLPWLQARIALDCDNQAAIAAIKAENLPIYNPNTARKILFSVGVSRLAEPFTLLTSPRFKAYAQYHGFEYKAITKAPANFHRQPHWIKIYYIREFLNILNLGDLIAFLDADIAIVRGDIEVTTNKSIAFAKDSSGIINSGVLAVRVNEFSKYFFEKVWNQPDCDEHPWQDNLAVLKVLDTISHETNLTHIEILPNYLNTTLVSGEFPEYDQYLKNPCVEPIRFRHFAGQQPWQQQYFSAPIDFDPPDSAILQLNLQTVNLIIFPDWQQPEESLGAELQAVLKTVATHPNKSGMTLLIYRGEMSEEDANLMLSTVAMNLLMEEDLDVSDGPVISLVGELDPMQWQALLPRLQGRIILAGENWDGIAAAKAENLPTYTPDNLP